MKNRVTNPESYIFSAIIYIGRNNFTSNDIAKILIERFSLQKTFFKAKAFTYNQIQHLVRKGLLDKVRRKGVYQYLYSTTPEFNVAIKCIDLIEERPSESYELITNETSSERKNVNTTIKSLISKYSSELEKISGAKEIYEELILAVPSRENEFRQLSIEQEKNRIRTNEKLNTLMKIVNEPATIT